MKTIKQIARHAFAQKKSFIIIFIVSIIISLINVAGSLVFQKAIDTVEENTVQSITSINSENAPSSMGAQYEGGTMIKVIENISSSGIGRVIFQSLKSVCVAVIVMYIFQVGLSILRGVLFAKVSKAIDKPITMGYYNHLMDLPVEFHEKYKTGDFISRFQDAANIRTAVSSVAMAVMLDTVMAIGGGILLWYISHQLFLLTAAMLTVYIATILIFKKPMGRTNQKLMKSKGELTAYLKESIDGLQTIKAFNYMNAVKKRADEEYNKFVGYVVKDNVLSATQDSLVTAIAAIGEVVLMWTGATLCLKGIISLSDLFAFYYLIGYFLNPVRNLVRLQPVLQTAVAAGERIGDIINEEIEDSNIGTPISLQGDIVLSNVDFCYNEREKVLHDVSMTFKRGQKTAIVGESGSGKTTISKLLMAFYKPQKGDITVNGNSIYSSSLFALREKIAYISQRTFLFGDTIYENLRMGNSEITDERIKEVCKACLADEFIEKLPKGYNTVISENGANLSGGQRQRLAIARALLRSPDILIMDEATSNLDNISENGIRKAVEGLPDSITVIIIAHRLRTIKACDNIYVVKEGKVVEHGTHDALMRQNGVYAGNWVEAEGI